MFRSQRIHPPAEAARTISVIATTSSPHLLAMHARAISEIAHARERTDPSSGKPEPAARPHVTAPTPPLPAPPTPGATP